MTAPAVDHAYAAHRAALEHLAAVREALDQQSEAEMEGDSDAGLEVWAELETAGPYCGCEDCEVREVLWAAYPHLRRLAAEDTSPLD
jgi:hypothetical protein